MRNSITPLSSFISGDVIQTHVLFKSSDKNMINPIVNESREALNVAAPSRKKKYLNGAMEEMK
jgi:hypothetical protein